MSAILINSSNACINEQLFIEIISSDDTEVIIVVSNSEVIIVVSKIPHGLSPRPGRNSRASRVRRQASGSLVPGRG